MGKILDPNTGLVPTRTKYRIFSIEMQPGSDDVRALLQNICAVGVNAAGGPQITPGQMPAGTQALWIETANRFDRMQELIEAQAEEIQDLKDKINGQNLTNTLPN